MNRSKKTVSLIFLACGLIVWLLFKEILQTVWAIAHLPIPDGWMIEPSELIAIAAGLATFIIMIKNMKVVNFSNDVLTELGKVIWPNRKETALSTVVVTILVAICAVILFSFDMLWGALVRIFYQ